MKTPNIEYCIDQGMDMNIKKGPRGDFIARVSTPAIERSAPGKTITAALEALEQLLSQIGPKP